MVMAMLLRLLASEQLVSFMEISVLAAKAVVRLTVFKQFITLVVGQIERVAILAVERAFNLAK